MKLLEKLDKAILDMKNQKYGFALSALMEIRAKLTPEFEIGEKVVFKESFDIEEFNSQTNINDCLFSLRDDHFYFNSPDWEFILPADEIEKFEVKK
jgi:hypothetical protein